MLYTNTLYLNYICLKTGSTHWDLGIILSIDLTWKDHYNYITAKAYKTFGLLRRTFSYTIDIATKNTLYLSLVKSQLLYNHCSPLWHPYLICDISSLERTQHQATKFILNQIMKHVLSSSAYFYKFVEI